MLHTEINTVLEQCDKLNPEFYSLKTSKTSVTSFLFPQKLYFKDLKLQISTFRNQARGSVDSKLTRSAQIRR